jgi:hypothetical protein
MIQHCTRTEPLFLSAMMLETEPELVLATENKVANELMLEDLGK